MALIEQAQASQVFLVRDMVCALSCQPDIDIAERLQMSLRTLCEALGLEAAGVFWTEGGRLEMTARWPADYPLEECDMENAAERSRMDEILERDDGCCYGFPMRTDGAAMGRLWVKCGRGHDIDSEGRELLILAANQLAMAYKKALLYQDMEKLLERRSVLLQRLMNVHERCALHVAQELHDEISQSMTALIVQADTVQAINRSDPALSSNLLAGMREEMVRLVDEINRVILDLRPSLLEQEGLVPALKWYGNQRLQPTATRFHISAGQREPALSSVAKRMIYRIGQEAIANVARHAEADNVWLDISWGDDMITLEVRDDGRGYDAQYVLDHPRGVQGLGLLGMQERALVLNGTLTLDSKPGAGATVRLQAPLEAVTNGDDSTRTG